MKFPLIFPCVRRGRRRGFTLVELLVSITVLSIMVGMMGTVLSTMGQLWHDTQKRVNNFSKARGMLDLMTHDLQAGVYRSDLSAFDSTTFSGSTLITFYTQRPGISTSGAAARDVSAVGYSLNNSVLQRLAQVIYWTDNPAPSPANYLVFGQPPQTIQANSTPEDAASGVVDFKFLFLHKDGTLTPTYTAGTANPIRAVGITLAVVDDQTLVLLNPSAPTGKADTLHQALEASATLNRSVKADWEDYLKSGGMNWSGYPKSLAVGLKIFERYVYLPNAS